MGVVYTVGVVIFAISVWAVIQLTVLGFFYSVEASTLIDDVSPKKSESVLNFLVTSIENYHKVSDNCYNAAYMYVVTIVISWVIIFFGKRLDRREALRQLYGREALVQ